MRNSTGQIRFSSDVVRNVLPNRYPLLRSIVLTSAATVIALGACAPDPEVIALSVRLCAIEGSPQAQGKAAGEITSGTIRLSDAFFGASNIWINAAKIALNYQEVNGPDGLPAGIPVIADPDPPPIGPGELGDIDARGGAPEIASFYCRRAWDAHQQIFNRDGVVLVIARQFQSVGLTSGVARPIARALYVEQDQLPGTGLRGDDLCGSPRSVAATELVDGWAVIVDPEFYGGKIPYADPVRTIAHELGHLLFLDHGNGLDDNQDGGELGTPGPRRFDVICDALGSDPSTETREPLEDRLTPYSTCKASQSLMVGSGDCRHLTPLQIEQARELAVLMPGAYCGFARPCRLTK